MRARFGNGDDNDDDDDAATSAAIAVEAAAMWTMISTPAENGFGVLFPVSRAWSRVPPSPPDFSYAIFDWDNLFASLLSGLTSKEVLIDESQP